MNREEFNNVEIKFNEFKNELSQGKISTEEMRNELKKLMIKDDSGNYWMIGGKTGKWYYFNGNKWIRKDPDILDEVVSKSETVLMDPADDNQPVDSGITQGISLNKNGNPGQELKNPRDNATVFLKRDSNLGEGYKYQEDSEQESDIKFEDKKNVFNRVELPDSFKNSKTVKCRKCGEMIAQQVKFCDYCGESTKPGQSRASKKHSFAYNKDEMEIKRIKLASLIFLFGGLGVIVGVVLGAVFGVLDVFPKLLSFFPAMLQDARGKLQGGLIFGALGGITFSLLHMILAAIAGIIYNMLSSIIGGIRFKL
jgi:hypothetical protein